MFYNTVIITVVINTANEKEACLHFFQMRDIYLDVFTSH